MTQSRVPAYDPCNDVHLIGRVTGEPEVHVLDSGDEMIKARITVPRPQPPAGRGKKAGFDTIHCSAWTAAVRRRVRVWCKDDVVEVFGSLRRRVVRGDDGRPRVFVDVELADVALLQQKPVLAGADVTEAESAVQDLFPSQPDSPTGALNASSA